MLHKHGLAHFFLKYISPKMYSLPVVLISLFFKIYISISLKKCMSSPLGTPQSIEMFHNHNFALIVFHKCIVSLWWGSPISAPIAKLPPNVSHYSMVLRIES